MKDRFWRTVIWGQPRVVGCVLESLREGVWRGGGEGRSPSQGGCAGLKKEGKQKKEAYRTKMYYTVDGRLG